MIDSQPVQILGLVLIHFIWQGLLIGLLFGVFRFVLKGHSAVARYNWGVMCLILLALAPLLTFAWLLSSPGYSSAADLVVMSAGFQAGAAQSAPGVTGFSLSLFLPWIVGVWLFGVMLMSARLGAGWWYVHELRCRADYSVPADIRNQLEQLAVRLNMARRVGLAFSSQIAGPMLIGLFKPLILLPASLINGLSARQVEMVLAHELSHLQRADHLVNLFQNIVETLLFYHPVVRWVSNEIRIERELISDEQAARLTGDRVGYAETLLQLEKVRGDRLSLAIGMADHQLVTRVRHLLAPQSRQSGSVISGMSLLTVLLVSALTALVSSGLPTFSQPDVPGASPASALGESTDDIALERSDLISKASGENVVAAELATLRGVEMERLPVRTEGSLSAPERATPPLPIKPPQPVVDDQFAIAQNKPAIEAVPRLVDVDPIAQVSKPIEFDPVWSESEVSQATGELTMASLAVPTLTAEIRGGELVNGPVPDYPALAVRRSQEGHAELRLTVNRDGRVVDVAVVEESPHGFGFGEAALQAVEGWRFKPFTRNGQAIRHEIRTGFDFTDPPPCDRVTGTRISRC